MSNAEIAHELGYSYTGITRITHDERYIAYREQHLCALDAEFVAMKPLAYNALQAGLNSREENTALRASEQWFKAAGFGGFSRTEQPSRAVTAEDVAAQLIAGIQVNVTVNTGEDK
jgi:hypothetical protein